MPYVIEVKAGQEYWLCTCGKSGTGLCNGAHQSTDKVPAQFIASKDETIYVCGCTASKNSPFCDGSHASLS